MTALNRIPVAALAGVLLVFAAPASAGIDKENLVAIISPATVTPAVELPIEPGETSTQVLLEVRFGELPDGTGADPDTFKPRFTGIKSKLLLPIFEDVTDSDGRLVGKRAVVDIPYVSDRKNYRFSARVKSKPYQSDSGRFRTTSDTDRARLRLRRNTPPVIANLRLGGETLENADGSWRVNPGQGITVEADLSDPDGDRVVHYSVDFGDNASAERTSSAGFGHVSEPHTYQGTASSYRIFITASDGVTSTSAELNLALNSAPVPVLRILPEEGTFLYPVLFDALDSVDSDGDALRYEFDFGDGTTPTIGSEPRVEHIYPRPGKTKVVYPVRVTARDSLGLSASVQRELVVKRALTGETLLQLAAPLGRETVQVGDHLPVRVEVGRASSGALIDLSSFDAALNGVDVTSHFTPVLDPERGGEILRLEGAIPLELVAQAGNNSIRATARSLPFLKVGQTTPTTLVDTDWSRYFRVSTNARPTATFTASPGAPLEGDTVSFDASASSDPEGAPLLFRWDFGDGTPLTTTAAVVTHVYENEGIYLVELTVYDGVWEVVAAPLSIPVVPETGPPGDPLLEISPDSATGLDFGAINLDNAFPPFFQSARERIVEIRNAGQGLLSVDSISLSDPNGVFRITSPAVPSLQAGESHFLSVEFRPTTRSAGSHSAGIEIRSNGGNAQLSLSGVGTLDQVEYSDMLTAFDVDPGPPSAVIADFGLSFGRKTRRWNQLGNQARLEVLPSGPWPFGRVVGVEIVGQDAGAFGASLNQTLFGFTPGVSHIFPAEFDPPNPHIEISFEPGEVESSRRFSAVMNVHWQHPIAPFVFGWVDGEPIQVGLMGVASRAGQVAFSAPPMEFQRIAQGQSTDQLGSARSGLVPARIKATYLAGSETVTGSVEITPIHPPGHSAFTVTSPSWTLDPDQLDPSNPSIFIPVEFHSSTSGHYSAVLSMQPNAAHIPARKFLLHGYVKGDNSIGVLGSPETLYFVDDEYFSGFSNDGDFSTRVIGLSASGGVANNGRGHADLAVIDDPFSSPSLEAGTDQWIEEPSDVVVVNDTVYAIDSEVFEHSSCVPELTDHACDRIAAGGIGTGAIVEDDRFLGGLEASSGDADLVYDGESLLELDATSDGRLFFTESQSSSGAAIGTRLRWHDTQSGATGALSDDLMASVGAPAGSVLEELRAIRNGTNYRLFAILEDGALYELDVAGSTMTISATAVLAPSTPPDATLVIDADGNWITVLGDGSFIDVCRESLHAGASSRTCIGHAELPAEDLALSVKLDKHGNVFVETQLGVVKFAPAGPGSLRFEGYVLAGANYQSDKLRGDDPEDTTADIDIDFTRTWFEK